MCYGLYLFLFSFCHCHLFLLFTVSALKVICSPYCALSRVNVFFFVLFHVRHHKMETQSTTITV